MPDVAWFRPGPDPASTAGHADHARRGVPHQLLGPRRTARTERAPRAPRLHRLRQHRRRQPPADQRAGLRHRPRAGRGHRLRPSVRRSIPIPSDTPRDPDPRAAGGSRARQGGLLRGARVRGRPDGDRHGLVPAAQLRLPAARGRRHRRDGQLRLAPRAGRHEPGVREERRAAGASPVARRAQGGHAASRPTARCSG